MPLLTPAQFAEKHGRERGAIYAAINDGRLSAAVQRQGRRVFLDEHEALAELKGHVYQGPGMRIPAPPREGYDDPHEIPALDESMAVERYWKAKQAELSYRRAMGELIEASLVSTLYADEVTACRTKLLGVVSRIRQRVTLPSGAAELIEELIREALEELGRSGGQPKEPDGDADI